MKIGEIGLGQLAWDSFLAEGHEGCSAYHGWIITLTANGYHLLTEETQQGPFFVEELGRKHPGTLCRFHQDRVETMARAAEAQARGQGLSLHPRQR